MSPLLSRLSVGVAVALFPFPASAAAPAGRYSTPVSGVVHDSKTGLDWQQVTSATTYTYADAVTYCSANAPGLPGSGWRSPALKELLTLVDDRAAVAPAVDTTAFPSTPSNYYWSSTKFAPNTSSAWVVSFNNGFTNTYDMTSMYYVRCVR